MGFARALSFRGERSAGPESIGPQRRWMNGFRVRRFATPRNDGGETGTRWHDGGGYPCFPAMISCNVATCRANAPRPAAVAVTVVCGFFPTNAFSTDT